MTNTANYYLVNFRVYKLRTLNHVLIMDHFYAEHVITCHSSVVKRPNLRVNIFLRTVDLKNTNIFNLHRSKKKIKVPVIVTC